MARGGLGSARCIRAKCGARAHRASQRRRREDSMERVTNEYYQPGPIAEQHVHVSWRAIFAGVLVALAVELLLTLLGFAVGLTAFRPTGEIARGVGVGIGL